MDKYTETCVEFIDGGDHLTISTAKRKYINKIVKWAKDYPNVTYVENEDGSVCAKVPIDWFRFPSPKVKKNYTDEQRAMMAERAKRMRGD